MYTFASSKTTKMNFRKEHIIYTLMWILLYISPVMTLYMRMSTDANIDFSWAEIFNAWKFNTVWIVMFAIHNFLLAPILILKRRTWLYTILCFSLVVVAVVIFWHIRPSYDNRTPYHPNNEIKMENIRPNIIKQSRRPPEVHPINPLPMLGPGEMVAALGGLLLMGMNLGVKLFFKSQEDSKVIEMIDRHNLERQLEYLKYQVNPHFFMNTLNNIHALVDIDPERAKTTILELSKMLRYILYEGNHRLIPLTREVQFLRNYVQLMSLRCTDRVRIRLEAPEMLPDKMLPPLMLIIFVENAFKHGISYCKDSFIYVNIEVNADTLIFGCHNSRKEQNANGEKKDGGMGLRNVRRRLDLLFPKRYKLEIKETGSEYGVNLEIPLSDHI